MRKLTRNKLKPIMALFLAFLTMFGAIPTEVLANATVTPADANYTTTAKPFTTTILGEEVKVTATGIVIVEIDGEEVTLDIPRYIHIDGIPVALDDGRIINIVPVVEDIAAFSPMTRAAIDPSADLIVAFSGHPDGSIADQSVIAGWTPNATVQYNAGGGNVNLSALRYIVVIQERGVTLELEGFCVQPNLPGPESRSSNTNYSITGLSPWPSGVATALSNGAPINPYLSDRTLNSDADIMWNVYTTRTAVARAANPGWIFNMDQTTQNQVNAIQNGTINPNFNDTKPAITVNGERQANASGNTPDSPAFNVTFNRRTNRDENPFTFRWADVPAGGATLLVNGREYTAPAIPTDVFESATNFQIRVYEQNQTARVELVGVLNQWAGTVFRAQNLNNPTGYQDIVFYIPGMIASVAYNWSDVPVTTPPVTTPPTTESPTTEPPTTQPPTTTPPTPPPPDPPERPPVRIQKIDALTRENIPGALMRLRGMSSHQAVTGDGQLWELDNTGINVSQVLTAGATTAVPGDIVSTVIDGVWTLEGLPFGFYIVEEERAPEGYSLLPQHTSYGFWILPPNVLIESQDEGVYVINQEENDNHILITFENYPWGEVVVYKRAGTNAEGGQLLEGATFRIQGMSYCGIPIDRTATTGSGGYVVFTDLPAGSYTVTEVSAPPGFMLGTTVNELVWSVSVTWGQRRGSSTRPASTHTFFNIEKSSLEILKICGVTNEPLAGAIFRLEDPTTGETWEAISDSDGIATFGRTAGGTNSLYPGRTLIVREIVAPSGFVLQGDAREIVLSPGSDNRITWRNYRNPGLTIIKQDQDTGERLAGAEPSSPCR